jgi:Asp-tRNA(Asn)/Glu-tRNA(Gln) amidotransferase B subunit
MPDDYRYFPEPDLTPFYISDTFLEEIARSLPELPEELEAKYRGSFQLPALRRAGDLQRPVVGKLFRGAHEAYQQLQSSGKLAHGSGENLPQ